MSANAEIVYVENAHVENVHIQTADGETLGGTLYRASNTHSVLIINGATGVPQGFYRRFAAFMQAKGITTLTYDFRGVGDSAPKNLKHYKAKCSDWGLYDIPAALNWVKENLYPEKIYFVGHSSGGQQAGLLEDPSRVNAMVTLSAQNGNWRLQGGGQKLGVLLNTFIVIPLLTRVFGYFPWSKLGNSVDLPPNIALQWAKWCRHPEYLLGDSSLPLERYQQFSAPVLAYSIDDDNWGTAEAVDSMMLAAYKNVDREHIVPSEHGIKHMGHMGFFRKEAESLWQDVFDWLVQY